MEQRSPFWHFVEAFIIALMAKLAVEVVFPYLHRQPVAGPGPGPVSR